MGYFVSKEKTMAKLHELIAVEPSLRDDAMAALNKAKGTFNNPDVLQGQTRKYQPLDEDGETFADERHLPHTEVTAVLSSIEYALGEWVDVSVQKEVTNTKTSAEVFLNGEPILPPLPAPALLNLESKLEGLKELISAIPTLDPAVIWHYDENQGCYASEPKTTYRTEKRVATHVEYEATKEHPAQVHTYTTDSRVGSWNTILYSGAIPFTMKETLTSNLKELIRAVKKARQRANDIEIEQVKVSESLFNALFSGILD